MTWTTEQRVERRDGEVVVTDESVTRIDGVAQVARILALIVGAAITIVGVMALVRIEWDGAEADLPVVEVAEMPFTPAVAIATTAIGVVLIAVAAGRSADMRLAVGGLLGTLGLAILFLDELQSSWNVVERTGWLAIGTGVVFLLAGLLAEGRVVERRRAYHEHVA
jgi:hypothetical protein